MYHQPTIDLLGMDLETPSSRLAVIAERERACGARFPASVREWFSIEAAEAVFHENTNQDHLEELDKLGKPEEATQGYLRVAWENQAVVAWYVRLNEGDDPPVYDNDDEWNEDLSKTNWRMNSKTFTNFIFDMISSNHFGGWYSGMHWSAEDQMPDVEEMQLLQEWFQQGPTTDAADSKVFRFFNRSGVISIRSVTPEQLANSLAEWSIEADSPESLFEFGKQLWRLGTLSKTLKAQSCTPESRSKGDQVLQRLRAGCSA
jgi:hypothetical protein